MKTTRSTQRIKAEILAAACPNVLFKSYQLVGINWLFLLHQLDLDIPRELLPEEAFHKKWTSTKMGGSSSGSSGGGNLPPLRMNGVLADDMGLGKTCQCIAFLSYLQQLQPDTLTHLIIVPASVLSNWENEFEKFAPGLEVWVYHGTAKERRDLRQDYEYVHCCGMWYRVSLAVHIQEWLPCVSCLPFLAFLFSSCILCRYFSI